MLRITIVSICLLILAATALADTGYETHDKELLFRVYGVDNLGLGTFDGGFGFRYFLGSHWALRPGFSYAGYTDTREADSDGRNGRVVDSDEYEADVVLEYHLEPRGRLSSYWGVGFSLMTGEEETAYSVPDSLIRGDYVDAGQEEDSWSVLGVLGVQWEATQNIHLGCEYQIKYRATKMKTWQERYEYDVQSVEREYGSLNSSTTSIYAAFRF